MRNATVSRNTAETKIEVTLDLDGTGLYDNQTGVGFFDLTSFAKFRVEGRDAEAVLQRIMANDIAVDAGKIVYGQWLNESGCIEADLTVTRLSETSFVVVTAATSAVRDLSWIKRNIPDEAHCIVTDITSAEAVFSLMGPKSRSLLEAITPEELSNENSHLELPKK